MKSNEKIKEQLKYHSKKFITDVIEDLHDRIKEYRKNIKDCRNLMFLAQDELRSRK